MGGRGGRIGPRTGSTCGPGACGLAWCAAGFSDFFGVTWQSSNVEWGSKRPWSQHNPIREGGKRMDTGVYRRRYFPRSFRGRSWRLPSAGPIRKPFDA